MNSSKKSLSSDVRYTQDAEFNFSSEKKSFLKSYQLSKTHLK